MLQHLPLFAMTFLCHRLKLFLRNSTFQRMLLEQLSWQLVLLLRNYSLLWPELVLKVMLESVQ